MLGVAKRTLRAVLRAVGVRTRRRIGAVDVVDCPGKGKATFAIRAYAVGEFVLPLTGEPAAGRGEYTIQTGAAAHLEPGEPIRYVNHSCDPNTGWRMGPEGRPGLHARRPIAPGEEITWDYAMAEADFVIDGRPRSFACRCGSAACRRTIEGGWSGLSAATRSAYREWAMPYLRGTVERDDAGGRAA